MCISFSRYSLGAHALNQIVFGQLIGVWEALTLHFIVREAIIVHMGQVMKIERSYIHTQNRLLSLMSVTEPLEKSRQSLQERNTVFRLIKRVTTSPTLLVRRYKPPEPQYWS